MASFDGIVNFVVFTRGRTGSTAICDDLDKHPNIVCHGEVFRREPDPHDQVPIYAMMKLEAARPLSAEAYFDRIRSLSVHSATRAFGFKILLFHARTLYADLNIWSALTSGKFRIIYLVRDPVRAALSGALANARNIWSVRRQSDLQTRAQIPPIRIDPQWVVDEARYGTHWRSKIDKQLSESSFSYVTVSYEDYTGDRKAFMNGLFQFLDVPQFAATTPVPFLRVTSPNVWDDISNAQEVQHALRAAEFALPAELTVTSGGR